MHGTEHGDNLEDTEKEGKALLFVLLDIVQSRLQTAHFDEFFYIVSNLFMIRRKLVKSWQCSFNSIKKLRHFVLYRFFST